MKRTENRRPMVGFVISGVETWCWLPSAEWSQTRYGKTCVNNESGRI